MSDGTSANSMMCRVGNIVTTPAIAESLSLAMLRVKSWENKTSPKLWAAIRSTGHYYESVFDAAHGRRYVLFLIPQDKDREVMMARRRAAFTALAS